MCQPKERIPQTCIKCGGDIVQQTGMDGKIHIMCIDCGMRISVLCPQEDNKPLSMES
jgi:hypothetical protein